MSKLLSSWSVYGVEATDSGQCREAFTWVHLAKVFSVTTALFRLEGDAALSHTRVDLRTVNSLIIIELKVSV